MPCPGLARRSAWARTWMRLKILARAGPSIPLWQAGMHSPHIKQCQASSGCCTSSDRSSLCLCSMGDAWVQRPQWSQSAVMSAACLCSRAMLFCLSSRALASSCLAKKEEMRFPASLASQRRPDFLSAAPVCASASVPHSSKPGMACRKLTLALWMTIVPSCAAFAARPATAFSGLVPSSPPKRRKSSLRKKKPCVRSGPASLPGWTAEPSQRAVRRTPGTTRDVLKPPAMHFSARMLSQTALSKSCGRPIPSYTKTRYLPWARSAASFREATRLSFTGRTDAPSVSAWRITGSALSDVTTRHSAQGTDRAAATVLTSVARAFSARTMTLARGKTASLGGSSGSILGCLAKPASAKAMSEEKSMPCSMPSS